MQINTKPNIVNSLQLLCLRTEIIKLTNLVLRPLPALFLSFIHWVDCLIAWCCLSQCRRVFKKNLFDILIKAYFHRSLVCCCEHLGELELLWVFALRSSQVFQLMWIHCTAQASLTFIILCLSLLTAVTTNMCHCSQWELEICKRFLSEFQNCVNG